MSATKRPWRSYELRFEISNLNYPGIHVHIASKKLFPGNREVVSWEPESCFPGLFGFYLPIYDFHTKFKHQSSSIPRIVAESSIDQRKRYAHRL